MLHIKYNKHFRTCNGKQRFYKVNTLRNSERNGSEKNSLFDSITTLNTIDLLNLLNNAINSTFEIGDILIGCKYKYDYSAGNVETILEIDELSLFVFVVGKKPFTEDDLNVLPSVLTKVGNSTKYKKSAVKKSLLKKFPTINDIDAILDEIELQIYF
jgi:hypothetical protein